MHEVGQAILGPVRADLDVLDLGCGTGAAFGWLSEAKGAGALHACDIASTAVRVAQRTGRATTVLQASMEGLPYRDESFDLVVNADVLQHLTTESAGAALREVRRVLRPGARLLMRVNGDSFRRGVRQRDNWRLYNPTLLRTQLEDAGLAVERVSYANSLPSLAAALSSVTVGRRHRHGVDAHDHEHPAGAGDHPREEGHAATIPGATGGWRGAVGRTWLRNEARWLRGEGRKLPFGHAVVAMARRPQQ
jgi:SAM-dependent methyltransferase